MIETEHDTRQPFEAAYQPSKDSLKEESKRDSTPLTANHHEIRQKHSIDTHLNTTQQSRQTTQELSETKKTLDPILEKRQEKLTEMLGKMDQFLRNDVGEKQDFFPLDWIPTEHPPTIEQQSATNLIYSRLMDTLTDIAQSSTTQAISPDRAEWKRQDYEKITEAIGPLIHTWGTFAKEQLPLEINQADEQRRRRKGDEVYSYDTSTIDLDDTPYENIKIFIRPEDYKTQTESRQARMTLTAIPKDKKASEVSLRLDYDNNEHANELVFDLEVISKGANLLDSTTLPQTDSMRGQWGHHFKSGITEKELGMPYSQVLRALVEKAEANRMPVQ